MLDAIGFLGCGKMGGALLAGWLDAGAFAAKAARVSDPYTAERLSAELGVQAVDAARVVSEARLIILAVKPHQVAGLLAELDFTADHLVVSVCAGVRRADIAAAVAPARVVRTMPNLGVRLKSGVTLVLGDAEHPDDVDRIAALFGQLGLAEVVAAESLFHAGTALVGSGPAYAFVAMQAMADGAVAAGMPRDAARRLAAATMGAAAALAAEPGAHPEALKDAVASPGGTTIAALGILEQRGFRGALFDAVRAAAEQSRALAGD